MKNLLSKIGGLIAACCIVFSAASLANAQTNLMRTSVPFPFLAGNQTIPAGEYAVRLDKASHVVYLRTVGGTSEYRLPLMATVGFRKSAAPETGALQFSAKGGRYVLQVIWPSDNGEGYKLMPSKAETELAKNPAAPHF